MYHSPKAEAPIPSSDAVIFPLFKVWGFIIPDPSGLPGWGGGGQGDHMDQGGSVEGVAF